jgi:hypothetical protein
MKTALQELIDYMETYFYLTDESRDEFKKALEKEKQQIKDAYNKGYMHGDGGVFDIDVSEFSDSEIYFNDTFLEEST